MTAPVYVDRLPYHRTQKYLGKKLDPHEGSMYHYTTVETMQQIMLNSTLWATHIKYMNDWTEYEKGYEYLTKQLTAAAKDTLISEWVEKIPQQCLSVDKYYNFLKEDKNAPIMEMILPEVYSLSFCEQNDLLSQWAVYSRESGVSIEFDFSGFVFCDTHLLNDKKTVNEYDQDDLSLVAYYWENKPHKLMYEGTDIKGIIETAIDELLDEFKQPLSDKSSQFWNKIIELYSLIPFYKSIDFAAEREVRLAFRRIDCPVSNKNEDGYIEHVTRAFHRHQKCILLPYIKIGWESADKKQPQAYPIKSITVGPGYNQDVVYRSIIHFINYGDHQITGPVVPAEEIDENKAEKAYRTERNIIVRKSKIPYIFNKN